MKKISSHNRFQRLATLPLIAVAAVFAISVLYIPAYADQYDAKIRELQTQNTVSANALGNLRNEAVSYQDAISKLQVQINNLQASIDANLKQQQDLQKQIEVSQAKLAQQKQLLGSTIKSMYVDGQPSTIEMLASSNNLSDFVDKEEYRSVVQSNIQETLTTIRDLQQQLDKQKTQIDTLLKEQQAQQATQAAAKAEQDRMLAYNQAQQSEYNAKIKDNQSRISDLRRQQSIENARLSGGVVVGGKACDSSNGDTYPVSAPNAWGALWGCSYALDNTVDNWGMYNRQCVSYTAWKVYESGRNMPKWGNSGMGNANQWDDNARRAGIPVDGSPRSGDVAVSNAGTYGHVMYVEHVYGDGSVLVSDYNQQWDGAYRRYTVARSTIVAKDLQFVHF